MSDSTRKSKALNEEADSWLSVIKELYGEKRASAYNKEEHVLRAFLDGLQNDFNLQRRFLCKIKQPISVGGTGIVFEASHVNMPSQQLILKFNRPRISDDLMTMVENERQMLQVFDHSNIIHVLDVGNLEIKVDKETNVLSFIIEPFVPGAAPLRKYVESLSLKGQVVNVPALDRSLQQVAMLVRQWVDALSYIHDQGYVYLDVKPDNVIVDKYGHLVVIDFGSTQKLDPNDENSLQIYFTERYADPRLLMRMRDRTSSDRVRSAIKRKELTTEFDYYALGKSILDLLNIILQGHPHDFPERPLFRSLHFLATRLLNGYNESEYDPMKDHIVGEVFGGLRKLDYSTIHYGNLKDVLRDLEKECGFWNPESVIPELGTYSKNVVRVTPDINTVLTSRLRSLIEHPLFARLKMISQLGLITLIYPTADHSRFDHVLGAYTYTASYVKSLFYDSQNPIFRNLVDERDIKAVLLAALLHDLGQYPLAHDLEEVHPKIFGHSGISIELISDETRDKNGKTLISIIKDPEDGWGVDRECLIQVLGAHSRQLKLTGATVQDFKADILSALIDGPIDADKADYIIRDSAQCRIPYGGQLDIERLLRVLTFVRIPGDVHGLHRATIGVYEKGRASADSFGLARYLLHSAVYWHHTSRILKSMLQYATAMLLPRDVFNPGADNKINEVHQKLLHFITQLVPPFSNIEKETEPRRRPEAEKVTVEGQPTSDVMETLEDEGGDLESEEELGTEWYPGISTTDWLMLGWLKELSDSKLGIALIDCILERRLYKRAHAIQREDNKDLVGKLEDLTWPDRVNLCQKIQESIYVKIRDKEAIIETRPLTGLNEVQKLLADNLAILVDIPDPKKVTSFGRPLLYVPELERKTYYHERISPVKADSLRESMELLMKSIAPIRVLCHPNIRQWVCSCITPQEMIAIVEQASEVI